MDIIYLLTFAVIGASILKFLKVPGAYLVGSLIGSAVYVIVYGDVIMPANTKFFAQAITGAFIGSTISKNELSGLAKIIKPVIFSLTSMVIGMLISGTILYYVFHFDLATALLSAVPGGLADITLMSVDFNADINTVALIQTMRLFSVLVFLPPIIEKRLGSAARQKQEVVKDDLVKKGVMSIILTLVIGFCGATIGTALNIPVGALSISMLCVILVNCFTNLCYLPKAFRSIAQIASGSLIGSGMTLATVKQFPKLFIPIVIVLIFYLIFNVIVSSIITKYTDMDLATAMFGTAPAGASEMVLIASEMNMNINQSQVVLMHIARLISVVSIFPIIIALILELIQ